MGKRNEIPNEDEISKEYIMELLSPHETWVMRIQSLLVWESPVRSTIFLLLFNFLFWLFAISNYRFFYVLGSCLLVVFTTHSWITKIWPEIKVPSPDDNEEWTYVHPVMLNVPELSEVLAKYLTKLNVYHKNYWKLRKDKPLRFCIYTSALCICGIGLGGCVPGRILVYLPGITLILLPGVWYHNLTVRIYRKFEPFFAQLDNSMDIRRSHGRGGSPKGGAVAQDSDSELDEFIPDHFSMTNRLAPPTADGYASSRSISPVDLEDHSMIGPPQFDDLPLTSSSGDLLGDDSSLSLLPSVIPAVDDLDQSLTATAVSPEQVIREDPLFSELDVEDRLASGLNVPDLQAVNHDDETTPNYLATVAGQTLTQMGVAGVLGLNRLAQYMRTATMGGQGGNVEITEIHDDDIMNDVADVSNDVTTDDDLAMAVSGSSSGDFEFIEHDDLIPDLGES